MFVIIVTEWAIACRDSVRVFVPIGFITDQTEVLIPSFNFILLNKLFLVDSNFLIDTQSLVVREIDFMIEKNSWNHNTHKFHLSKTNEKLVVRRGTPFKLKVKFNRRINKDDDIINIIFTIKGNQ